MSASASETYATATERVFASWQTDVNTGASGSGNHTFSPAADYIQVVKAGRYNISVVISWSANATGYRRISLQKNSSTINNSLMASPANLSTNQYLALSDITLAANDTISVSLIQNSGATLTVAGALTSRFNMTYLGT
jgi:hypothetical protein